jgi:hypothetical protein
MMMDDTTREALLIKENATLREVVQALREEIEALKQTQANTLRVDRHGPRRLHAHHRTHQARGVR